MQQVREVCLERGVLGTQRLALGGGREEGVGEGKNAAFYRGRGACSGGHITCATMGMCCLAEVSDDVSCCHAEFFFGWLGRCLTANTKHFGDTVLGVLRTSLTAAR